MKTLPKNLLIALCIINLQGCFLSGRYNHDWYSGPQAHKEETRRAINTVLHHSKGQLKWDWNKHSVHIRIVKPAGKLRGKPYIMMQSIAMVTTLDI